jgi:hypothetical protein
LTSGFLLVNAGCGQIAILDELPRNSQQEHADPDADGAEHNGQDDVVAEQRNGVGTGHGGGNDVKQNGHCQQRAKAQGDLKNRDVDCRRNDLPANAKCNALTFSPLGPSLVPGVKMPEH